CQQGDSNPLTF
nr:immunoglobulin light chain junction region [Macaca mulatta]MOW13137.1 immunoglobulin light chain junction region [Macaca mulatta]MOW13798.1 immunoglobulin light chain junction region [Macaca mulatta]MOW14302.1 immunoglobulin light chain junction region [Macaca mulatta]MOW14763.1 immunoglobulin light chain junction region [Macaca mulatta]